MFIDIKNARKHYGDGETLVNALDGVSLSLGEGKIYVILGPSGSGKSTLLNMIGGLDSLDSGEITISGRNISRSDKKKMTDYRREDVGFVFQFYNLIPVLNVEENITLPQLLDGQKVNQRQLQEIVEMLGLQNRMDHLPNQLSGGQQQRVSIGRALINKPALVLADEPTGNLDSKNSAEIVELLKMFNKTYRQTLIVITHDERIALQADRIIAIEDGRIAKDEVIRP